jgi:hypothetical protein
MDGEIRGGWLSLTAYTTSHRLTGRLFSVHLRFTDALTLPQSDILTLEDCVVSLVGRDGVGGTPPSRVEIDRRNLAFVIPDSEPENRRGGGEEMRVPKVAHPVAFLCGHWSIAGHIHLPPGVAAEKALDFFRDQFLPVTQATATFTPKPKVQIEAGVLLVNRGWVAAFWPLGLPR